MASAKETVAFTSILASGLLTALKLTVGLLTGSLGILSEAAHSALDCAGTVLTFIAIRIGDKPPDHDHPYGHGKVESIAALAETALLFATSAWIIGAAAGRLLHGGAAVEATWSSVGVMALSMVIDFFRSRKLTKVARETNSPALEADALHFRSDIYSSGVVILGLGLVYLGYPLGDPLAAIGVALFVLRAGYRLGRETIETLIDTAPEGIDTIVRGAVQGMSDVSRIERVRGGPRGSSVFVDLEIAVARTLPLERVAEIKEEVTRRVQDGLPGADVLVMTRPLALDDETILDRVLVIAASQGVPVHHVTVQHVEERISVSFDLEVDGRQSMAQAHVTASALERGIRLELGDEIEALADATPLLIDAHEIRIRATEVGLYLSLHCHVPPEASVEHAHDAVSELEQKIRRQIAGVRRIIVHAEPPAAGATEPA